MGFSNGFQRKGLGSIFKASLCIYNVVNYENNKTAIAREFYLLYLAVENMNETYNLMYVYRKQSGVIKVACMVAKRLVRLNRKF